MLWIHNIIFFEMEREFKSMMLYPILKAHLLVALPLCRGLKS